MILQACGNIERRYRRLQEEKSLSSLILSIVWDTSSTQRRWKNLRSSINWWAAAAKQEEIGHVLGQEDQPIRLEHHSPILHLIQQIRDETHRFAVAHRRGPTKRTIQTGLKTFPVRPRTAQKLLRRFGTAFPVS